MITTEWSGIGIASPVLDTYIQGKIGIFDSTIQILLSDKITISSYSAHRDF